MKQYLNLLEHLLVNGQLKQDRTGVGTLSIFGHQMRFDLKQGFPLLTTKKLYTKSIIHELLWFLKGDTNIQYLHDNNVHIWDEWADDKGDLGPIYGHQWRSWTGANGQIIDQISNVIHEIKTNPNSRRLIVSAWNVAEVDQMALPPCHVLFQFYVTNGKLSCQLYQRSCDVFLGLPFNIASYALLIHLIAYECKLDVGEFVWTGGDTHLYQSHINQALIQIRRHPKQLPYVEFFDPPESIFDFEYENIKIINYYAHSHIKAPIAV